MTYPDVWIVVPAFDEASVICDVVRDLRSVFGNVIVVDDGAAETPPPPYTERGRTSYRIR